MDATEEPSFEMWSRREHPSCGAGRRIVKLVSKRGQPTRDESPKVACSGSEPRARDLEA